MGSIDAGRGEEEDLEHVEHDIDPVFDERSEVLVLGTMPSPASREAAFFYGHPRNRFWPVLAELFDEPVPENNAERTDFLLRHHIALWDVLASCDIHGASDASIANPRPNDLSRILGVAPVGHIFCTGSTSARLYHQLREDDCGMAAVRLPSTSPANAAWSLPKLVEAYRPLADAVSAFEVPALDVADVVALEGAIASAGTSLSELMRRAGRFLAFEARKLLQAALGMVLAEGSAPVVVLCGNGNNGGDGWVAGEYLDAWGIPVRIVTAIPAADLAVEPARTAALEAEAALSSRSSVLVAPTPSVLEELLAGAPLAIDALLGTGFAHAEVREPLAGWIRALNAAREKGAIVIAADVPSGLSAQTGAAARDTVRADHTVTMIAPKPGLLQPGTTAYCGQIRVAPLAYIEPLLA